MSCDRHSKDMNYINFFFLVFLIHILITLYLKIIFFYFKDIEKESAGNDDKKIMLYNKKWQNIENMLLFLKKYHVSLNNDPNGWGWSFVFCIFAYIIFFIYLVFFLSLFLLFLFIYLFLQYIFCVYYHFVVVIVVNL